MTKNDCLNSLCLNLAKTSTWRELQFKRWPQDTRNARAAKILFNLAAKATDIDEAACDRIAHFDSHDPRWHETVSNASRDVGFRSSVETFDDYVQTVVDTMAGVSA